jgi:hypothetical protein
MEVASPLMYRKLIRSCGQTETIQSRHVVSAGKGPGYIVHGDTKNKTLRK